MRTLTALTIAGLALPAHAQEPAPDFQLGEVSLGLSLRDSDTDSSKFLEYRDIPDAASAPQIRILGKRGEFRYSLWARDVSQGDQRYGVTLGDDVFRVEGLYTQIPHNFGNGGKTLLTAVSETEWLMSDDLQRAFQTQVLALGSRNYSTVFGIVNPSLQEGRTDIDVALSRKRSELKFSVTPPESRFGLELRYFHERRAGTRGNNGTSFGFNNVVETAEPVRYRTQDIDLSASLTGKWGVGRVGFGFNDFSDEFDSFVWDNPFRAADSTDPVAYLAPYNSVNGPEQGRSALPPSSQAWRGTAGASFKLPNRTRLSLDVAVGRWTQNRQEFLPFTINSVLLLPDGRAATDPDALPARSLDGRIDTLSLTGFVTTALGPHARLNARYRLYDNDNKTPRIRFEQGYVRFDAVFEEIPRISVPYGFKSKVLDVYADVDLGERVTLEAGYRYSAIDRSFRETRQTTENGARVGVDVRVAGLLLRGSYELARRGFDGYDAIRGEEESFLEPEGPTNQPALRRFDQAERDLQRIGGSLQYTPESGKATLLLSYTKTLRDYDETPVLFVIAPGGEPPLGLVSSDFESFSAELDVSPSPRASVYVFYSRENVDDFQRGRESGATLSFDTTRTWTSTVADAIDSFGAGVRVTLVPDTWTLDVSSRWQRADGDNAFTGGDDGSPEAIPLFDDSRSLLVSARLEYQVAKQWGLALGGFFEDYELRDAQVGQVLNYMPGSFFLNANNADYQAWVGYLNMSYGWN